MNVLIRLDYSPTIGLGHLMRCIALAVHLRKAGAHIIFVTNKFTKKHIIYLKKYGFQTDVISSTPTSVLWLEDAEQTIEIIKQLKLPLDWIIVDHYGLDIQWETAMRPYTKRLMVIDDLANRMHDCDLLLDQNIYVNQAVLYDSLIPKSTLRLFGPEFALLRDDFLKYRMKVKKHDGHIRKILICFGGGDNSFAIIKALEACNKLNHAEFMIDVVAGMSRASQIKELCSVRSSTRYFSQINNIAELMVGTDLVIGAGGCSLLERCCLGLPAIVLTTASNQLAIAEAAAELGVLKYLGEVNNVTIDNLTNTFQNFLDNPNEVCELSDKASRLVDGLGCDRVMKML